MSERRVYKNPPILEAVCEFRFVPGSPWDWTIPGLFFGRVCDEFPEKKHQNVVDVAMEAQGESVKQTIPTLPVPSAADVLGDAGPHAEMK